MDFEQALASLALQHPSTPLVLEIEFLPDVPIWEAAVLLRLNDDEEPVVACGNGSSPLEALDDLRLALIKAPHR